MKRVMGLSKPMSMMEQMNNFFVEKADDMDLLVDTENENGERKIKSCAVCKVQKANHIVREYANTGSAGNSNNTSALGGAEGRGVSQTGTQAIGDQLR